MLVFTMISKISTTETGYFFIFGAFSVKAWRKNGESLVTIGTSLATDLASLDLLMRISSACLQLVVSNLN